jgi:hypothetical protein
MHAIWVFWHGPQREFRGWYVNLQEPFRRTSLGVDTQDLELDILIAPRKGGLPDPQLRALSPAPDADGGRPGWPLAIRTRATGSSAGSV